MWKTEVLSGFYEAFKWNGVAEYTLSFGSFGTCHNATWSFFWVAWTVCESRTLRSGCPNDSHDGA